jgi:hypothetical protein
MYMAMYSWMPVQYMAETVRMVCDEEVKVSIRCVLNFSTLVALLLSGCYNVSLFVCYFVYLFVCLLNHYRYRYRHTSRAYRGSWRIYQSTSGALSACQVCMYAAGSLILALCSML